MNPRQSSSPSGNRDFIGKISFGAASILVFAAMLILFKLLHGMMPDSASGILDMGSAKCIANSPGLFNFFCPYVGYPYGHPAPFGMPLQVLIANISELFHLSVTGAYHAAYSLALGVAFIGCIKFFNRFVDNYWIALFGTILFLANPIVSFEGPYGALRIGFALLPAYVYMDLVVIDYLKKVHTSIRAILLLTLALSAVRAFALFCDGYSFVMALFVGGFIWAAWLMDELRQRAFRRAATGSAMAIFSIAISVVLYRLYIPHSQYAVEPLDMFRGQGIDLFMFLVPSPLNWAAAITGLHHNISGYQVYSDGPSSSYVYLGYSFLICSMVCAWLLHRKSLPRNRLIALLMLAGLAALVLSLGPSLKWHDFRPDASGPVSYSSYLMPASDANFKLGTGWIYEHVPGIRNMRALYRWQLVTRLALVVAALSILGLLIRRKRYVYFTLLCAALIIETMPSMTQAFAAGRQASLTVKQIDNQPARDLRTHITPGTKTVFLELHPNADNNPYLATYLCANARIYCYNVGGDKATILASSAWPVPVYEMLSGKNIGLNGHDIFRCRLADVIVVPFFDLRWQAYAWPPRNFPRALVMKTIREKFPQDDVQETEWFAFIKPKAPAATSGKCYAPGTFTNAHVATVTNWGPSVIRAKSKNQIYVWVQTSDAPAAVSVVIGDHMMATLHKDKSSLAAPVRKIADRPILDAPGTYPIYLVDKQKRTRQKIGEVRITR